MEEPKTLSYDWQYGREELFLRVDSYMSDDNLYIGLYHMEDGYPESFADLTVNLPFAPLGGINEAYIDHNFSKEKLRFIKQHKLGTIQPDTASSGYCIFQRVAFDLKKLAELDPEGTKRFMERNGIRQRDVPKQKQTSVYKGYKQDKIEMRGDRAEMSDFPLYLNTVAGGLDRRDQTIGGFSFVVKIYAVPVVEIIG